AVLAPGSRSAPLAMALHADGRVRLHVRVDERSAAFLALGLAKASGRPAAVLCTSGTAAANFHPAVLEAHESRVPLLVLTADRPPELRGTGANQTTDQVKLYGQAVRWFCEVGVPEARAGMVAYWRATACRAWAEAAGSPAGPVHLNVALREPLTPEPGDAEFPEPLDGRADGAPWVAVESRTTVPDADLVEDLAARAASVMRGALVVGETSADPYELVAFADRLGWPVIAEAHSGARQGPSAVAMYHHLLSDPSFADAHRPDFVVRVGRTGLSRPLEAWLRTAGWHTLIDRDAAWLDPGRSVSEIIVAEPGQLLGMVGAALADLESDDGVEDWNASWGAADRRARDAVNQALDAEGLTEPRVARDVAASLPPGATLVVGSSMPIRDLDQTMAPRGDVRVLANRGVSGIDGFVSTAVGVALAAGPAVALCGDLSLLHDANGLLGADADLTLVVVNNDGGGIFSFLPQARHPDGFERLFGTPHGADLEALARAYGAAYTRVTAPGELRDLVAAPRGVRLAEVRTDRAANVALHQRLRDAVSQALAG
ncbi:MAG TPA: 2-succinyl-5-enolpyruvyl-6-hydroxy-3-cyclohexene-1-carboxylic-acid synthase, partial [Egibacteraceae bacterium]|nr:2-succinyl-5-enolpyruvyl-6-hydroxy-3-cyclohexene-1-carboxylic-acid synthase [Egibacteraceae bacterium]